MLIFDGAEVPSNRILLEGMGVTSMGISFFRLWKRGLPKNKPYLIKDRFPDGVDVFIDAGSLAIENSQMLGPEVEDFASEYQDFLVHNADRISGATELTSSHLGMDWALEQRDTFWAELGEELFWPVWSTSLGYPALMTVAQEFSNVASPHASVEADTTLASRVNALATQYQTSFHGLAIAKPDNLRSIKFDTVSSLSWLSPMRRGETIVWDGTSLKRYPQRMKDQARMRYRSIAEKAGLDFGKIANDDSTEVTRLAIWSYLQLESHLVTNSGNSLPEPFAENTSDDVANRDTDMRKLPEVRQSDEKATLPVFGIKYKTIVDHDESGNQVLREVPVVESQAASLRQCNTCFVAANCPAFKPDNMCAFNLPVEVKTKDQLRSLINAIIEMQGQRVAFARFSEELNGGYPDPNTGLEIDRLFKLVKTLKELESNNEFVRMTVERQTAGGVLSALFGDRAASLKDLPNGGIDPEQTNRIIDGSINP